MSDPIFPAELSDEEVAAGFRLRPIGATCAGETIFAAVHDIAAGLRAVKTRRPDGSIEYAIWDATNNVPIYFSAPWRTCRFPNR